MTPTQTPLEPTAPKFVFINVAYISGPVPSLDYVVQDFVPKATVTGFVGRREAMKTWAAYAVAVAVSQHDSFLGRSLANGRVAIIDFEMGWSAVVRRLHALLGSTPIFPWLSFVSFPEIFLSSPAFEQAVLEAMQECRLLIIDSFLAGVRGVDENGSYSRWIIDTLKRCAVATGCAVIIILHAGKGDSAEPRGTSAIADACDQLFAFTKVSESAAKIAMLKNRHGIPWPHDVTFRLVRSPDEHVRLELVPDPRAESSAEPASSADPANSPAPDGQPDVAASNAVLQFITEHPGSTVTRIRATKLVPSHRNLDVVLAALQDRGHVVRRGKGFFTTTARDEQQPLPAIPPPPSGAGRDETNIEDRDLGGPAQPPRPPEGGGRGGPEQPAQAGPGPAQGGGREELGGAVPFWRKP